MRTCKTPSGTRLWNAHAHTWSGPKKVEFLIFWPGNPSEPLRSHSRMVPEAPQNPPLPRISAAFPESSNRKSPFFIPTPTRTQSHAKKSLAAHAQTETTPRIKVKHLYSRLFLNYMRGHVSDRRSTRLWIKKSESSKMIVFLPENPPNLSEPLRNPGRNILVKFEEEKGNVT